MKKVIEPKQESMKHRATENTEFDLSSVKLNKYAFVICRCYSLFTAAMKKKSKARFGKGMGAEECRGMASIVSQVSSTCS